MPFGYSGSSRPKKAGGRRSSTASMVSQSSNPTPKGSNSIIERPKKVNAKSKSRDSASKTKTTGSPSQSTGKQNKETNVFDFLDEKDEAKASSSSSDSDDEDIGAPSKISQTQPKSTTSAATGLQLARKGTANRRSTIQGSYSEAGSSTGSSVSSQDRKDVDLSTMPEAYYPQRNTASLHRTPFPPSPPKSPDEDSPRGHQKRRRNTQSQSLQVSSGYGFLASHLSASPGDTEPHNQLPPLYRRFEHLNHRVLLHLQDEIAQMEEELHVLDEYEEMHRFSTAEQEGTKPMPASRRMDTQAQAYSNMHYRRLDLMGTLIHKTEQYNNSLCAYTKVLQNLPPAPEEDIETYRTWMKEKNPVVIAETRFLDYDRDLVSMTPRPSSILDTTPADANSLSSSIFPTIVIASTAILIPLLAFNMISEFSGRLVVVTIVGGAAAAIAANYSTGAEKLIDARDGWRSATIYFGFMILTAMFIP